MLNINDYKIKITKISTKFIEIDNLFGERSIFIDIHHNDDHNKIIFMGIADLINNKYIYDKNLHKYENFLNFIIPKEFDSIIEKYLNLISFI